jgi:hypothetical protein
MDIDKFNLTICGKQLKLDIKCGSMNLSMTGDSGGEKMQVELQSNPQEKPGPRQEQQQEPENPGQQQEQQQEPEKPGQQQQQQEPEKPGQQQQQEPEKPGPQQDELVSCNSFRATKTNPTRPTKNNAANQLDAIYASAKNFRPKDTAVLSDTMPAEVVIKILEIEPQVVASCSNISFDERRHAYYYKDPDTQIQIQNKLSVTELLKLVFDVSFAGQSIALALARKVQRGDAVKCKEYFFIDRNDSLDSIKQQILNNWSMKGHLASTYGTAMHAMIEDYYKTGVLRYRADMHREISLFCKFVMEYQFQPWAMEYYLFDVDLQLAGSVDGIFKSPTDNYAGNDLIIVDWKRSRDLDKSFHNVKFQSQSFPFCKRFQYSMQVNVYKYLLEKSFNFTKRVVHMYLWVVDPSSKHLDYEFYEIPYFKCMEDYLHSLETDASLLLQLQQKGAAAKNNARPTTNTYYPSHWV